MRRLRFFILEKILLPIMIVPLRLLIRTWRAAGPDDALVAAVFREPRLVFVTCHGMFLHLLRFAQLAPDHGRRLVVMLSPSLDGRLLAASLRYFGIDSVSAASGRRGVAGAREFRRRIEGGDIGVVAVDGPRGPRGIVKPGALQLAAAAHAAVVVAVTVGRAGLTLGSWDRAHLPLPFARVALAFHVVRRATHGHVDADVVAAVQHHLVADDQTRALPDLGRRRPPPDPLLGKEGESFSARGS